MFNEYGVQIMTPAYEGDPAEPKIVPPKDWHLAPAPPPGPAAGDAARPRPRTLRQETSHLRNAERGSGGRLQHDPGGPGAQGGLDDTHGSSRRACGGARQSCPSLAAQTTAPAGDDTRETNLTAYVELLRTDVRAQKTAFLTEMMEFTEVQDAVFWPIYREYDVELAKLGDERIAMIREYTDKYGAMTDALAEALAKTAIDLDRRRAALLEKYYTRVKTALSPTVALRFLQVEHQMLLILDLQVAAMLPVAK